MSHAMKLEKVYHPSHHIHILLFTRLTLQFATIQSLLVRCDEPTHTYIGPHTHTYRCTHPCNSTAMAFATLHTKISSCCRSRNNPSYVVPTNHDSIAGIDLRLSHSFHCRQNHLAYLWYFKIVVLLSVSFIYYIIYHVSRGLSR